MSAITLVFAATTMLTAQTAPARPRTAAPNRERAIWSYVQRRIDQQADVWFDLGEYPKIIQVLKIETEAFPADYEVATNLGWMQENVQNYPGAIEAYRRFIANNPTDPDAPLPLAQMLFNQRKYPEVPALLEPAVKRTPPPHPNVWRILAHSYERTNRLEDSRRVWMAYLKISPNDAQAKVNLKRVEGKIAAGK